MRIIPTRVHGVIEYIVGLALIAAPWLFDFATDGPSTYVPVALGIITIIYSLITDYELGVEHIIPMPIHLWIDFFSGLFLAASPWLFGFYDYVYLPHLVVGIMEMVVSLITETQPSGMAARDKDRVAGLKI